MTQVSLEPPPWEELTTSEPRRSATRVSPPGRTVTFSPATTNGRRSMWRPSNAMPTSASPSKVVTGPPPPAGISLSPQKAAPIAATPSGPGPGPPGTAPRRIAPATASTRVGWRLS